LQKALLAGAAVLLIAVIVLWKQLGTADEPAPTPPQVAAALPPPPPAIEHVDRAEEAPVADVKPADAPAEKMVVGSDRFFREWMEMVTPRLSSAAIKCVERSPKDKELQRWQEAKLEYDIEVKNGVVTVANVKLAESNINDSGIEACFVNEVLHVTWTNDALPDLQEHRTITFSPGRGMKKYREDNRNYVGPASPHQ
jgi:hypothetical protein